MSYYRRVSSDLYIYRMASKPHAWVCDHCPLPGGKSTEVLTSRLACFRHWVRHRLAGHDAPFRGRDGHGGIARLLWESWRLP